MLRQSCNNQDEKENTTIRTKEFRKLIQDHALNGTPIEAQCPHVQECGGCSLQHCSYNDQVQAKTLVLHQLWHKSALARDNDAHIIRDVVPSPNPYTYRTRMDYVTSKGRIGLRKQGRWNYIIQLETCHLIPPIAFHGVLAIWKQAQLLGIPDYNLRTHNGFLRYLVVRRSPQDTFLIAAVTAEGPYDTAMEELAHLACIQPGIVGFHWLINDTRTDLSMGNVRRVWGSETLPMQVRTNTLHIGANTFFQNNVHLLPHMLNAIATATTDYGDHHQQSPNNGIHVADLYGGVGLIALHLAHQVGHVVTVESHQESSNLAVYNVAKNLATNISVVANDVLTFTQSQAAGQFDCIITDPPRTGMGEAVCTELLRLKPRRIVYVSCNPVTQLADLACLVPSYRVTLLQGYDMFPHTPHVEVVAVLDVGT